MNDGICIGISIGLLAVNALVIFMALMVGIADAFPRLDAHGWQGQTKEAPAEDEKRTCQMVAPRLNAIGLRAHFSAAGDWA